VPVDEVPEESTASERMTDHFKIQKSRDVKNFETILEVSANGFSNQLLEYESFNANPRFGTTYYRLVQVDYDGTEYILPVRTLDIEDGELSKGIQLYPNPVQNKEFVLVNLDPTAFNGLEVRNLLRQSVHLEIQNYGDRVKVSLPLHLPSGVYTAEFYSYERRMTRKFIVE
jgi:hypothetical protein